MKADIKDKFLSRWKKYFNNAELPITFYYTDEEVAVEKVRPGSVHRCVIAALKGVRQGKSLCFDADGIGCPGGKRYLGFSQKIMPDFEYFLSCGITGKLQGERYKKSPELVRSAMEYQQPIKAPGRYIVFKRWDHLSEDDTPSVVIFFARPDVLSGLFTLSNFDQAEPNGVIAPFGSGCSTIVHYPFLETAADRPRAIIGMFDVSARPFVNEAEISFSVPLSKFITMINNMDESFLITKSWKIIQKRID